MRSSQAWSSTTSEPTLQRVAASAAVASRGAVPASPAVFHDSEFSRIFGQDAPPRGVLHVVGRLTEAVFHMLGPTCAALRAEGRPQAVVLIDDATGRRLIESLDPAIAIHFVEDAGNPLQRWFRMGRRVQAMVNAGRWEAVHLHGLMPLLVGSPLARRIEAAGGRLFVTPHNSRSLRSLKWAGRPLLELLNGIVPLRKFQTIANVPFDVRAMGRVARVSARLVESPVDEVFFSVNAQREPQSPVIVGGGPSDAVGAVKRFAQLAVLLADALPGARFRWLGPVTEEERSLLDASGVEMLADPSDPYARAHALAEASLYVAPKAGRGFPMALAEAMAVGLACIGYDGDAHQDMLTPGETGVVAGSVAEIAQCTLGLMRDKDLRQTLAAQARREAMLRFSDEEFRRHLAAAFRRSSES